MMKGIQSRIRVFNGARSLLFFDVAKRVENKAMQDNAVNMISQSATPHTK